MNNDYLYVGNLSAVDPVYSRRMVCHDCRVSWTGCWDTFQCPICGEGELPTADLDNLADSLAKFKVEELINTSR